MREVEKTETRCCRNGGIWNKKVRNALTEAKNNWIERQVEEIEDNLN